MDDFKDGYEFAIENGVAAELAGQDAASYLRRVEAAIGKLYAQMSDYGFYKDSLAAQRSLKGFIAEEWAAGTANVDAALKDLPQRGTVLHSRALGSADVAFANDYYQLKTLNDPEAIASKLSKTLRDAYESRAKRYAALSFEEWTDVEGFSGRAPEDLLYGDMKGLIPADKLEAAKEYCTKRVVRAQARGLDAEVKRWTKVRDNLTDRIRASNGVESRPLDNSEAMNKAVSVSKGERLNPADDGMTTAQLVKMEYVLQQSLRAGASAAALSAALKVAPELYKAIDFLISEGRLDEQHLRAIGSAAGEGAANGFIAGTATAAITLAAGRGLFGQAIKTATLGAGGSNVIGALVVLTMETCKDSFLVASGKMQPNEMGADLSQSFFASVCMLAGLGVASLIAPQAAIPALIGSFVGGTVGSLAFKPTTSCILRVCRDSGLTFFGLVDQSYEIPKRLMDKLGLRAASVKLAQPSTVDVMGPRLARPNVNRANIHVLDIAFVERGLVGVNKIGYAY